MGKIKDLKGKKYDSGIEVLEFEGIKIMRRTGNVNAVVEIFLLRAERI